MRSKRYVFETQEDVERKEEKHRKLSFHVFLNIYHRVPKRGKKCSWCKNSFRGKSENWIKLRLICNAVKNSFPSASPWVKRNTFDPQYPIDYAVSSQKASEHESSQFSKTLRTNQQKENFSLTFQRESPLSTFSTKKRENLGTKRR